MNANDLNTNELNINDLNANDSNINGLNTDNKRHAAGTDEEKLCLLQTLEATDADTGFMHEGFHADDPSKFTRPWFAWANSLFSELVTGLIRSGKL
ncbi:hypothetical protein GCM10010969_22000 [Saccharibacillus kuerlensis]|uniref:Metal-independent alpha-mannosidase n=1 Tax=Saccharibacillus kuerlensis TaxID=459527 RepID=A0ABQ2L2P4_9BACL|nr:hypothetical protein GCM10010969_22000 [Saccharibacillus kuerlensis]